MRKINFQLKRILSLTICLVMLLTSIAGVTVFATDSNALSGVTPGVKRIADPSTMDSYSDALISDKNGTRYAGRVWSDKSVFTYDELNGTLNLDKDTDGVDGKVTFNDDFLHAFSVLGSSMVENSVALSPLDFVISIDITSSMLTGDGANGDSNLSTNSNLTTVLKATNDLIKQVKDTFLRTRISIVVYWGTAYEMIPLVEGTPQFTGYTVTYDNGGSGNSGSLREPVLSYTIDYDDASYKDATGIYDPTAGTNTITNDEGSGTKNGPVQTETNATIGGGTNVQAGIVGGLSVLAENERAKDLVVLPNGEKTTRTPVAVVLTDGASNHVFAMNGDSDVKNGPDYTTKNTSNPVTVSGEWWNPYVDTNGRNVSVSVAPNETVSNLAGVLSGAYWKAAVAKKYSVQVSDVQVYTIGFAAGNQAAPILNPSENDSMKSSWTSWENQTDSNPYSAEGGTSSGYNSGRNGGPYSLARPSNTKYFFKKLSSSDTHGVTMADMSINYPTQYFPASATGDSTIVNAFKQLLEHITNNSLFIPVNGSNDAGADGSLTYMDPIGKYMEVKNVSNVSLFGNLYGITKSGVYDYNFNSEHSQNGIFTPGWYDSSGNHKSSGSWENGDTYYLDESTAKKYISSLNATDSESIEKQHNTVYTCYEFNVSESERQKERINQCYGKDSTTSYKLSDIKIWIEDTGHYIDDSVLVLQSEFNQSLYVDIPVKALPLQTADVEMDKDLNVESYTTNLSIKEQSTPLRIFYTVGLADDYKTDDGASVDLSKVSQEYLDKYRSSNGDVHFLSNYYSGTNYDGYVTLNSRSQGDPVVTFNSSENNRYYVFQRSLPLYSHAYILGNDGTLTRVDPNNGNGNGVNEWKAGATWDGGICDGEYSSLDEARKAAQEGKITQGHIVLIHDEVLDDVTEGSGKSFSPNDYFFMTVDYYMPTGSSAQKVECVIARLGSQFSSGVIANGIESSNMLCWYDMSGKYADIYTYHSYEESNDKSCGRDSIPADKKDGTWVLATKPGGIRVGNMGQNVVSKGGNYNPETHLYENNKTGTANNTYLPTISKYSSVIDESGKTSSNIIIDVYLGNNGRLSVSDTMLLATKTVKNRVDGITSLDQEFNFQAYIEGVTGTYNAIVVARNSNNPNVWQRRISTIDILSSNQNLLLDKNSSLAKYSYNGSEYYIYLPSNEIGGSNIFRAYIADETQKETGETAPANVKVVNEKTGVTKFYSENQVYLIPVSDVDNAGDNGWSFNADSYSENKYKGDFLLCTLDPRQDESAIDIQSDYDTETTYLTKTLTFGLSDDEESYDSSLNNEKARQNTASFTLKDGEGLLFTGIASGADYRVTEKLTDLIVDEGYSLDEVKHIQLNSSIDYDKAGNITAAESNGTPLDPKNVSATVDFNEKNHAYSTFGHTSAVEEAVHYTNAYDPVHISISKLLDEADGAKLTEADYKKKFDFSISLTIENGTKSLTGSFWFELFQDKISDDGTVIESESLGRYPVELKNGVATFQLQGNQHIFIYGLPVGTEYTSSIHEDDQQGWKPKIKVDGTLLDDTGGEHTGSLSNNNGELSGNELVFTNVKQPPEPTNVSLNAKKQVTGDAYTMNEGDFSFRITPDKNNPQNDPVKEHTAVNDADGIINLFNNIEYDTAGTYKYTIEELFGNPIPNMEYDKTVYTVTVEVFEDQANDEYRDGYYGKLKAKITITKENGESTETVESIVFSNTYREDPQNGQLSVSKTVKNSRGKDNTPFNFTVTFTGTEINSPTPVVYTDRDGRGTEKSVQLTSNGDKKYTGTFQLKDGETITFTNLPVGTAYTVTESKHSGYFLSDKSGDTGEIKAGTTAKANFINVIALVLPETGGIGLWPFLITGGLVLLASLLIAYHKYKRKNRFN